MKRALILFLLIIACVFSPVSSNDNITSAQTDNMTSEVVSGEKNNLNLASTDALGRTLPEITGYRDDRYVGLFYFIWHSGSSEYKYDVTKLLRSNPDELWDPYDDTGISPPVMHYFNEPLFGYYSSEDPWVVRKHVEMFIAAGVDFIALDLSNDVIYEDALMLLLETMDAYRQAGWDVPKFICYTNLNSGNTVKNLYDLIYSRDLFSELWFYGPYDKPLIVAQKNEVEFQEIKDFFHFRPAQWPGFEYEVYEDGFPFCDLNRPQRIHENLIGVSVAQHTAYVFSYGVKVDPLTTPRDKNHGRGYTSKNRKNGDVNAILRGANIQEQWDYAIKRDPEIIFVTGWNEWATGKRKAWFEGQTVACFVDSFNTEFSRDIEMTKESTYIVDEETGAYIQEGYADNYYLQMIQNIRKYKGISSSEDDIKVNAPYTIDVDGTPSQWNSVKSVYYNISIDNISRDCAGYTQAAADNFIQTLRVAHDSDYVYFYIRTENDITAYNTEKTNWMNLFIGIAGSENPSWDMYQFVLNRHPVSDSKTSLERYTAENEFEHVENVSYSVQGNIMQIAVPRASLGLDNAEYTLYFKAADSIDKETDIMDYYVSGESVPLGRLAFSYRLGKDDIAEEEPTTEHTEEPTTVPTEEPTTDPEDLSTGSETAPTEDQTNEPVTDGSDPETSDSAMPITAVLLLGTACLGIAFVLKKKAAK